jgi:hypothetical protein
MALNGLWAMPTLLAGVIFIFAGEELQIIITPDGKWMFLDAPEL